MTRSYGDPVVEYEAARSNAIVVLRDDRAFVRVHGRDPVRMVQGLITNDLAGAPHARAVYAGLLTPKGRLVAELRVSRKDAEILLETAETAREAVVAHFKKFIPPLFARFETTDRFALLGVYGPKSGDIVATLLGTEPPGSEDDTVVTDNITAVRTSYAGDPGWDLLIDGAAQPVWDRLVVLGVQPAGQATLDVLRIEAGSPKWGAELDDSVIPLEAGLRKRMISESKGCYTGQEIIVRILHRGHVNRNLRALLLGDAPSPAHGTELLNPADSKVVGKITSACASPRFGQTIALGYVRREIELPGTLALTSGAPVTVIELPFAAHASVVKA